jgi:hypothetical protein
MTLPDDPDLQASPLPPEVRFVKALVAALAGVMIVGIIVIVGLLAWRLTAPPAPFGLPAQITLPAHTPQPEAVTLSRDWVLVLVGSEILLFDRVTGALRNKITLPAPLP